MSRDVWVNVILAAKIEQQVIENILQHGEQYGCAYIDPGSDDCDNSVPTISAAAATQHIMHAIYERSIGYKATEYNIPGIHFQYEGARCHLIFSPRNNGNGVEILLSAWIERWFKGDPDDKRIDWARYIRLVLDLCQDFPILELKTEDSYFESSG